MLALRHVGWLATALLAGGCTTQPPIGDRPESYLAQRTDSTILQHQDFTCGAASLATLLTYYWGRPTTEAEALGTLKQRYTEKQIAAISQNGMSFDDLIFMAGHFGFSGEGAKVPLDQLADLSGPVIVHLDKGSLKHFVVLRKVGDDVYYVADPVVGQLTMNRYEFSEQYTGNALAVWKVDAALPPRTRLTSPRDGVQVGETISRGINVPNWPYMPAL